MDSQSLAKLFESLMLVAFGCAWPTNILNTLKRKSTIGKSLVFLLIIITGYIFGISAKIVSGTINYVFAFYVLNFVLVSLDLVLYFFYRHKERLAGIREDGL
jgi:hypothetical protein